MGEESHLDEMRAAIRGDFERLERRLGAQELMQVEPEEPAGPEQVDAGEPPEQPRRSWLDRVLGR